MAGLPSRRKRLSGIAPAPIALVQAILCYQPTIRMPGSIYNASRHLRRLTMPRLFQRFRARVSLHPELNLRSGRGIFFMRAIAA
jgi:hypothetical protein